jgi:MoaA/NifB/PqqE/SkfB family radical SAM enzyme
MRVESELLDGTHELIITGHGDAFASPIYRNFLERFDAMAYPDTKILLMTNGLLFTRGMWRRIASSHPAIVGVSVSVDAATPDTYQKNRGGDFGLLMRNLEFISELVSERKLWTELSFVVQTNNYREIPAFVDLAKSLRFDRVLFQKLIHWSGTFSEHEFSVRAVHLTDHPEHQEFLEVLKDSRLHDAIVDMSNLQEFLGTPVLQ